MPNLSLANTLADTIRQFPSVRVLIAGDVMLDQYVIGTVSRISPEAPVPVVDMATVTAVPGGAANVAANIVSLGGTASLIGVVGNDSAAGDLREACSALGISAEGLVGSDVRPTTTKMRIVAEHQQICRLDRDQRGALDTATENALIARIDKYLASASVCVLSDYDKGCLSHRVTRHLIESARIAGKPVIVDPKVKDFSKYSGATLITPNTKEAELASGERIMSQADVFRVARLLCAQSRSSLLITQGASGMTLFTEGRKPLHVPARAKRVFDVTGAGDTVVSTLALASGAAADLKTSVLLANMAAGIAVQKPGTAQVTVTELLDRVNSQRGSLKREPVVPALARQGFGLPAGLSQ
jgi:rfaE bifunctional protein kinase chain/domain